MTRIANTAVQTALSFLPRDAQVNALPTESLCVVMDHKAFRTTLGALVPTMEELTIESSCQRRSAPL